MALDPGTRFGPYEIAATLGAGGMGEVYRATDTRLRRDVALKVLKSELGADADRLRRMEQEALATAALNHPNIVSVYDVGREQGRPYVVAELLEGETLRERLRQGALPVRKAIDLSVQLANGLAAAHQKGITHRDLKPENLFMTRDGRLKILDFGLAKMVSPVPAPETATGLPGTEPGMVMGTIGYMAPEQLRGQPVDHRSDIFSTGAVLYEMLSGERAFRGDSPADTMSAILHQDPRPLSSSARHMPPALHRIIDRCLEKDPNERFHSAHDLGIALEALSGAGGAAAGLSGRRIDAGWVAAAVFLAVAVLAVFWGVQRSATTVGGSPLIRFSIGPPPGATFVDALASLPAVQLAISPDGQQLAFIAKGSTDAPMIWLRRLDGLDASAVAGTEGAAYPFWSPDSRSLGFFADNKIKRVDLDGGRVQSLGEAVSPRGGTWSRDGVIVFAAGVAGTGLYRVPATGGELRQATTLDKTRAEASHRWPQFLPDGNQFIFHVRRETAGGRSLSVGALDGRPARLLADNADGALFVPPDRLVFIRDRSLMMLRWDGSASAPEGDAIVLLPDVSASSTSYAPISASANGILVLGSRIAPLGQPTWFDRSGRVTGTFGSPDDYYDFRLSPDERVVAVVKPEPSGTGSDVWIVDRRRNSMTRATFAPAVEASPVWSPDGTKMILRTNRNATIELVEMPTGDASTQRHLVTPGFDATATDWSGERSRVLYHASGAQTGTNLYMLDPQKPVQEAFLEAPFNQMQGKFSPDSRWVAYTSNESGKWEVYARAIGETGLRMQLSTNGGVQPIWRGDMKEIFYLALDGILMRVSLSGTAGRLEPGVPQKMFQTGIVREFDNIYRSNFAATRDGQQFLFNVPAPGAGSASITVIVNWLQTLVTADGNIRRD